MRIALSLIVSALFFVSIGFAQTDPGTSEEVTKTETTTMSKSHVKSDDCTAAKVRSQLMDNGIFTKSAKSTMTPATGTTSLPPAAEIITVDVDNGVVTLTGAVVSPVESDRIVTIVKGTDGVTRVVSNLQVGRTGGTSMDTESTDTTSSGSMTTESHQHATGDAALTTAVKNKLSAEGTTIPPIQVETEDGIVTLTGTVANEGEAERLILLVRAVPNVKSVKSNLKVRE
jgi:hyperosmotically inducible periplasmic protein